METTEQILERQDATFSFKNGKVEYFSISTQWDEANTIDEAVKNILQADKKYNGKAPIVHWVETTKKIKLQDIFNTMSGEEIEEIVYEFCNIKNS